MRRGPAAFLQSPCSLPAAGLRRPAAGLQRACCFPAGVRFALVLLRRRGARSSEAARVAGRPRLHALGALAAERMVPRGSFLLSKLYLQALGLLPQVPRLVYVCVVAYLLPSICYGALLRPAGSMQGHIAWLAAPPLPISQGGAFCSCTVSCRQGWSTENIIYVFSVFIIIIFWVFQSDPDAADKKTATQKTGYAKKQKRGVARLLVLLLGIGFEAGLRTVSRCGACAW